MSSFSQVNISVGYSLPEGPLIAWYGDDFTGAAAVMEAMTFAGLPAILFLELPTADQLTRFSWARGIGLASTARSQSPAWMEENLPAVFETLAGLGCGLFHYKVCTTLDSAPHCGSIGKAIEIGSQVLNTRCVPVVIAAPQMRRYQVYGHLFAAVDGDVYRLDRHPVMRQHPITPIDESDVARHLARQTDSISFKLINRDQLNDPELSLTGFVPTSGADRMAVTLDNLDASSEAAVGRLLWSARDICPFVVGSQGVQYALIRYWQEQGTLKPAPPPVGIEAVDKLVVVSGSVSPVTAQQIRWSRDNGFSCIAFDASKVCESEAALDIEIHRVIDCALKTIESDLSPLVHSALGPEDPAIKRFTAAIESALMTHSTANQLLGAALGRVLSEVLLTSGIRRAVISGGDTSGFAARQLGVYALTALAPTIPGAAIFRAHANGRMDGLQLALKGGQMGSRDYFGWVKQGGGPR